MIKATWLLLFLLSCHLLLGVMAAGDRRYGDDHQSPDERKYGDDHQYPGERKHGDEHGYGDQKQRDDHKYGDDQKHGDVRRYGDQMDDRKQREHRYGDDQKQRDDDDHKYGDDRTHGDERRHGDDHRYPGDDDDQKHGDDRRKNDHDDRKQRDHRYGDDHKQRDDRRHGDDKYDDDDDRRKNDHDDRKQRDHKYGDDHKNGDDRRHGDDNNHDDRKQRDHRYGDDHMKGDDRRHGDDKYDDQDDRKYGDDHKYGDDRRKRGDHKYDDDDDGDDRRKNDHDDRKQRDHKYGDDHKNGNDRRHGDDKYDHDDRKQRDHKNGNDQKQRDGHKSGDERRYPDGYGYGGPDYRDNSHDFQEDFENCCKLTCIIRDQLKQPYSGFEGPITGLDQNIVKPYLGEDGKPVYNPGSHPSIPDQGASFGMWFHDGPNTQKKMVDLELSKDEDHWFFTDNDFFPIDNQLYGNQGYAHNYHFTVECHTWFQYKEGAKIRSRSDDDMWVFVNKKLAIDLGGVHPVLYDDASLDALSLVPGEYYPIDIFFAERHTIDSVFSFKTNFPLGKVETLVPYGTSCTPVAGWNYTQKANKDDIPDDFFKQKLGCTKEWKEGKTPFGKDIICELPNPATVWDLNTFLALRKNFTVPHGFLDGTGQVNLIVDNDILKVYVNGHELSGPPFTRDDCAGVTAEETLRIPPHILHPGVNLLAVLVHDRGVQSFFNAEVKVLACHCVDYCHEHFKKCKFTFEGYYDVPTFDLEPTQHEKAFTPRIMYKDPSAPVVGNVQTNSLPHFVDKDGDLEYVKDYPKMPGMQHFSDHQFKAYHIGQYSGIGHEAFRGNKEQAKGKCVKIHLTNWEELSGSKMNNMNHGCPECCVVFKTDK